MDRDLATRLFAVVGFLRVHGQYTHEATIREALALLDERRPTPPKHYLPAVMGGSPR